MLMSILFLDDLSLFKIFKNRYKSLFHVMSCELKCQNIDLFSYGQLLYLFRTGFSHTKVADYSSTKTNEFKLFAFTEIFR